MMLFTPACAAQGAAVVTDPATGPDNSSPATPEEAPPSATTQPSTPNADNADPTGAGPATAETASPSGSTESSPTASDPPPDGWESYDAPNHGFSVSYPAGYGLCEHDLRSLYFCDPSNRSAPVPCEAYITVYPRGFKNMDASAYNWMDDELVDRYFDLPVGDSLEHHPGQALTRLPDRAVDGEQGVVLHGDRVHEAPTPETKERRVLVRYADRTFIVGIYYDTPAELACFDNVVASLDFIE